MTEWLITDTHFNHKKLVTIGARPADFQQRIITNWKHKVRPEDTVRHLGDVIVGQQSEMKSIIEGLPGIKILIRGNHDTQADAWYIKRGFKEVHDACVLGDVLLTHEPSAFLYECRFNVHGHYHNSNHHMGDHDLQPWHKLLAIENTDYCPVEFEGFRNSLTDHAVL